MINPAPAPPPVTQDNREVSRAAEDERRKQLLRKGYDWTLDPVMRGGGKNRGAHGGSGGGSTGGGKLDTGGIDTDRWFAGGGGAGAGLGRGVPGKRPVARKTLLG